LLRRGVVGEVGVVLWSNLGSYKGPHSMSYIRAHPCTGTTAAAALELPSLGIPTYRGRPAGVYGTDRPVLALERVRQSSLPLGVSGLSSCRPRSLLRISKTDLDRRAHTCYSGLVVSIHLPSPPSRQRSLRLVQYKSLGIQAAGEINNSYGFARLAN
jgi:hypothetical protein